MTTSRALASLTTLLLWSSCHHSPPPLDQSALTSMGSKFRIAHEEAAANFQNDITTDSTDLTALLGLADTKIISFLFGYIPQAAAFPVAAEAVDRALRIAPENSEVQRLAGIIGYLDWDWKKAEYFLGKAIETDPKNKSARHWYSLYLACLDKHDQAMAHSDTIMTMDPNEDYLIGRGSHLYFQERYQELVPLMETAIARDTSVPWGYDWLGMAYNGLDQHDQSIETYYRAFTLSDGTVEVGGGLGHALAEAGEIELAKQMTDYYDEAAKTKYLPPCQRAFIHIGLGEHEKALSLLEQAYEEKSWYLIFMNIEPWYNPIRNDPRFQQLSRNLNLPK